MAKRRSGFSKLWIVTALLAAGFIAVLFYLQKQTHEPKHTKQPHATAAKKSETKPKFDFYTVLPQGKSEAPASTPSITTTTIPSPSNSVNSKYLLQVAAVKTFADADKLKAQLILQGFDVSIQKINVGGVMWNRVNVGPFNTLGSAQQNQANLRKLNINSILLKIKL